MTCRRDRKWYVKGKGKIEEEHLDETTDPSASGDLPDPSDGGSTCEPATAELLKKMDEVRRRAQERYEEAEIGRKPGKGSQ